MSYISVKFKEDTRDVFKKDEEIKFDFSDNDVILITGPNGCGKSTLINSLRSHICSNEDRQDKALGTANLLYSDIRSFLKPATEVDTDFKNMFYLSSEFDDPLSMFTSFDACAYIENGGWATAHVSKGQRLLYQFAKFMKKYKEKLDKDTVIIFDEVDTGYDLKNQITFYRMLPIMCLRHKCKCIVVTHCAIPFIYGNYKIYDLKEREYVEDGKEYLDKIYQYEPTKKDIHRDEEK